MTGAERIWVVIPAFNEGTVVGEVLRGVRALYGNVVVVDDCSGDETGAAALAAGAVVLRHPINLGQGAALETGMRHALRAGAELIVTFDADGQHRPEDIAVLLETQRNTNADVVIGSRFLGQSSNIPPMRRVMLKLAIVFTRLTSGVRLTDAHNGLRLLTRRAASLMRLSQNRMAHASEIVAKIAALRLSVAEAPMTVIYTEYSLRKGQRLGNAFHIVADLFLARLHK